MTLRRKRTKLCEEFAHAGPGENPWRTRLFNEILAIEEQIAKELEKP